MLFLPNDDALEAQAKAIIDDVVAAEGLKVRGAVVVLLLLQLLGRVRQMGVHVRSWAGFCRSRRWCCWDFKAAAGKGFPVHSDCMLRQQQ
jgi:hypothetical protein